MTLEPLLIETRRHVKTCGKRPKSAVLVEAATALAAKAPGRDVLPKERSGRVAVVPQAFLKHLHDRHAGVQADQIGERERPQRMDESKPGDRVDRLSLGD